LDICPLATLVTINFLMTAMTPFLLFGVCGTYEIVGSVMRHGSSEGHFSSKKLLIDKTVFIVFL
jgi:hypothetical protein